MEFSRRVKASLDISMLMSFMLYLNADIAFNLFEFTMGSNGVKCSLSNFLFLFANIYLSTYHCLLDVEYSGGRKK